MPGANQSLQNFQTQYSKPDDPKPEMASKQSKLEELHEVLEEIIDQRIESGRINDP